MDRMIEVARNSVQTWEIDQMGHMNVQFYVDRALDGLAALAIHLGVGSRGDDRSLVVREQHIRFLRERRSGSPYFLRAGVLGVSDDTLKVYQEMVDTGSGDVAATFTQDLELRERATQAPATLPPAVRDRAVTLQVTHPEYGRPRGLEMAAPRAALTLSGADAMGLVPTFQGLVRPEQCDGDGWLDLRHFMGMVSNAIPNLLVQTSGGDRSRTPDVGGAALEYRFVYRRYPRAGDVAVLRSGLRQLGEKTYTWCHWLFDLESGEALASAEVVAISLDLQARKAIPVPETLRTQLAALLLDGLSA